MVKQNHDALADVRTERRRNSIITRTICAKPSSSMGELP